MEAADLISWNALTFFLALLAVPHQRDRPIVPVKEEFRASITMIIVIKTLSLAYPPIPGSLGEYMHALIWVLASARASAAVQNTTFINVDRIFQCSLLVYMPFVDYSWRIKKHLMRFHGLSPFCLTIAWQTLKLLFCGKWGSRHWRRPPGKSPSQALRWGKWPPWPFQPIQHQIVPGQLVNRY